MDTMKACVEKLGVGCSLVDAPSTRKPEAGGLLKVGVLLELQNEFWANLSYKAKSCLRKQWLKETDCGGGSVGKVPAP